MLAAVYPAGGKRFKWAMERRRPACAPAILILAESNWLMGLRRACDGKMPVFPAGNADCRSSEAEIQGQGWCWSA
jgi:hypothetical protein